MIACDIMPALRLKITTACSPMADKMARPASKKDNVSRFAGNTK